MIWEVHWLFPNREKGPLRSLWTAITLTLALTLPGCSRFTPDDGTVAARVKDRTLTYSDISAWEAAQGQPISAEQKAAYIRHWVEEEVLIQAALDNGLQHDSWVAGRIEELTRRLVVARYLELETLSLLQPAEADILSYFNQHRDEFVWPELHLVVDYWRSGDRAPMARLREQLIRGAAQPTWTGSLGGMESGRLVIDGGRGADASVWNIISRLRSGQTSGLEQLRDEYWVFRAAERREAGEAQGIDDVRAEIIARLTEINRSHLRDILVRRQIEKLRRSDNLMWNESVESPAAEP